MITPDEKAFFLEQGYLQVPGVLNKDELTFITAEYERVWAVEKPSGIRLPTHKLLQHKTFLDLVEHPAIIDRVRAVFGSQAQLLSYDFLRHGPRSQAPERSWHRDFAFPGDNPLTMNVIVYLDEMNEARGPTRVVPKSHFGTNLPSGNEHEPLPNEVAAYAKPGDAVFINGAIWHTGGRNDTDELRRGIYIYYGYWWLKRYGAETELPWQAIEGASEQRLQLLGYKMPGRDLHMYVPEL
ncbi:MAG: phytanoyl-CoA dioxygenase family protein [Roseiflexaceae bacterium]|nr:phytanoyl-CoA dioxygenase family protein [Roseiflexaceae bacterium]